MSTQPFAFPPPPPPPPRRTGNHESGVAQPNFVTQPSFRGRGSSAYRDTWGGSRANGRAAYGTRGGLQRGGYGDDGHNLRGNRLQSQNHSFSKGRTQSNYNRYTTSSIQNAGQYEHAPPSATEQPSDSLNVAQKRSHQFAFARSPQHTSRPLAAPAVPSFNAFLSNMLPQKASIPAVAASQNKKKPRTRNILGLTPTSLDYQSSSEDEDEEAKLAQATQGEGLHIEYKGQTSTLRSAAEIKAWLAERKKRFPTQAKAEASKKEAAENKLRWEAEKRSRLEAGKRRQEEREMAESERNKKALRKKLDDARIAKEKQKDDPIIPSGQYIVDATTQAKLKAERLRKKALKAQKELARAEQKFQRAQAKRDSVLKAAAAISTEDASIGERDSAISLYTGDLLEGPATELASALQAEESNLSSKFLIEHQAVSSAVSDSSNLSDADNETSSSGSSSSSSSSGEDSVSDSGSDSDSHSSPEIFISAATGPLRVPPPPRRNLTQSPNVCRSLLKTGKCNFGARCRYSHDVPLRAEPKKARGSDARLKSTVRRKGLYDIMVEKEKLAEREKVLRAIITLGDNGMLGA